MDSIAWGRALLLVRRAQLVFLAGSSAALVENRRAPLGRRPRLPVLHNHL